MDMKVFRVGMLICMLTAVKMEKLKSQLLHAKENPVNSYRETPARINDLIHTRLEVSFDYKKRYLYGKEWVTLKPHFFSTDSLRLDAKGMQINNVSIVKNGRKAPLEYTYDSLTLNIRLDKTYHRRESYTIFIDYFAKPYELPGPRNDGRGLYFINADENEPDKPTQIWTQGQTEYNSVWFPTIDKPNQKTTQEIAMTVPAKFVTLSNGLLVSRKVNPNGTRTDIWKMDRPHSPYLFMMAVGDFAIHRELWKGKEVSYFLEPEYAPHAKDIFGFTPEAMEFFSRILGVDFPWPKYSQIRVRDYVSGAMENTSATVYGEDGKVTKRELADLDFHESGAVHELFHQWFGDYVTAESWSNLTLNESFANFGEMLWAEYKYGKDVADERFYNWRQGYLGNSDDWRKTLVRFDFEQLQDLFDGVTFSKGSCIVNMLRNYLGNDAFYAGLRYYLEKNALKSVEVQDLRLAMEEVSGKDLNWFFNQWYYRLGHPVMDIRYEWNDDTKMQAIYLKQTQEGEVFTLPMAVEIYAKGKKERHMIWMNSRSDTFTFSVPCKPDLVNVDADKILLAKKTDHKTLNEYKFQYTNAPLYIDRVEAIEAAIEKQTEEIAQKILIEALQDKFYGLRRRAIEGLNMNSARALKAARPILIALAQNDSNNAVRAGAITALGDLKDSGFTVLFKQAMRNESYIIQGAGLRAFALLNPSEALAVAKNYERDDKGSLGEAIIDIYGSYGSDDQWRYMHEQFTGINSARKYSFTRKFAELAGRVASPKYAQQGVEAIKNLVVQLRRFHIADAIVERLNEIRADRLQLKDNDTVNFIDNAIIEVKKAK